MIQFAFSFFFFKNSYEFIWTKKTTIARKQILSLSLSIIHLSIYLSIYLSNLSSIYKYILKYIFIVVQVVLSPFPCHPFPLPHPSPPPTLYPSLLSLCPWVVYTCSLTTLPLLYSIILFTPTLWLTSVCSLLQCLWLYFSCLFILLIRFHL